MKLLRQENEIKLDILRSLARSQRALSRIIESIADTSEQLPQLSHHLIRHMALISEYQRLIADKMTLINLIRRKTGKPGKPWLNRGLLVAGSYKRQRNSNPACTRPAPKP